MSTAKQLQDALVYAIESAMRETLPMGIRPEVVFVSDAELEVGTVQILIRSGMGLPMAKPTPLEARKDFQKLPTAPTDKA